MELSFVKVQGIGNDFILIDQLSDGGQKNLPWQDFAQKLCNRRFGIGADGILILEPSDQYDIKFRIYNSDGSVAQMCGNGMRCAAKYLYENDLVSKKKIQVETLAGLVVPEVILNENGTVEKVRVDMGKPVIECAKIPFQSDEAQALEVPITAAGKTFSMTAVSMGNPHAVIFVDDPDAVDLARYGAAIEHHPCFPELTNVEFVQVISKTELKMRVWERGAGITLACGTGACAVLVAAVLTGKSSDKALIHLDGGDLDLEWDRSCNRVFKTGPAEMVFKGVVQV